MSLPQLPAAFQLPDFSAKTAFPSTVYITSQSPWDGRSVVPTLEHLYAISHFYKGMEVWVWDPAPVGTDRTVPGYELHNPKKFRCNVQGINKLPPFQAGLNGGHFTDITPNNFVTMRYRGGWSAKMFDNEPANGTPDLSSVTDLQNGDFFLVNQIWTQDEIDANPKRSNAQVQGKKVKNGDRIVWNGVELLWEWQPGEEVVYPATFSYLAIADWDTAIQDAIAKYTLEEHQANTPYLKGKLVSRTRWITVGNEMAQQNSYNIQIGDTVNHHGNWITIDANWFNNLSNPTQKIEVRELYQAKQAVPNTAALEDGLYWHLISSNWHHHMVGGPVLSAEGDEEDDRKVWTVGGVKSYISENGGTGGGNADGGFPDTPDSDYL